MEGAHSPYYHGLFLPRDDGIVPSRFTMKQSGVGIHLNDGLSPYTSSHTEMTYPSLSPLLSKSETAGLAEINVPLAHQQVPQLPAYPMSGGAPSLATSSLPTGSLATAPISLTSTSLRSQLTPSQRGELELAKQRAERASSSKKPKLQKRAVESDYDSDNMSDLDISRLPPEEQEAAINAKLATVDNEKDAKRLKRLLRNRISAQQARERKKHYVTTLEDQLRDKQTTIDNLEAKLRSVDGQNAVLRRIIQSMKAGTSSPGLSGLDAGPTEVQQESASGLLGDVAGNCSC